MEAYPLRGYNHGCGGSRSSCPRMGGEVDNGVSASEGKAKRSRASETSRSHKEAERRRRQRINAHLSTLRSLLPNTIKTDKASLLSEVVHRVRELRRQTADAALDRDLLVRDGPFPFPGETNEAAVSYASGGLLKATLCCDDRPGLNQDVVRAIGSVGVKPVRAEMATVGGRTGIAMVMERAGDAEEEIGLLKRALDEVVDNRGSGFGMDRASCLGKRVRFCDRFGLVA